MLHRITIQGLAKMLPIRQELVHQGHDKHVIKTMPTGTENCVWT